MVQSVCFEGKEQQKASKLIQTVNRGYWEWDLQVSNSGCFKAIIKQQWLKEETATNNTEGSHHKPLYGRAPLSINPVTPGDSFRFIKLLVKPGQCLMRRDRSASSLTSLAAEGNSNFSDLLKVAGGKTQA